MRTRLRILGAAVVTSVAVAAVPILSSSDADAARFTIDNVVVYRVGTGAALTNAAAPVFLDEYTQTGTLTQSIALPTTTANGNSALTASGLSRSEGLISRSADGKYLAVTGYDAAPGATGPGGISLTGSAPASVARVVGIVDANGIADTSTAFTAASTTKIIRSAVTDGDRIWATGGNGGIVTTTLGSATSAVVAGDASSNFTSLTAQGGQLFAGGILTNRIAQVGTGVPSGAATLAPIAGLPANLLAYGYALVDVTGASYAGTGLDTLYVANATNRAGTLDKYRFDGTNWVFVSSLDLEGITGLVANASSGNVSLAITTPTTLVKVLDVNAGTSSSVGGATPLATATAGTEFRGIALAPTGTPGPSTFVRSPATGSTVNISSSGVPVSAYVKSPGAGVVNGVTLTIGSTTVNATKGAGDVWTGTVPNTSLTAGAATLTVAATGTGGTTTVTRAITLNGTPPVVTPPVVTPPVVTPTAPADALQAGKYAPSDAKVAKSGKWKAYSSKASPSKKGLVSKKKGSSLTTKVYGGGLTLTFDKTPASGQVRVTIDGKVIDLYGAKLKSFAKKFKFSGALASHTVVISVVGTKKAKSTGISVNLAALEVTS
jgi:hypothetical protein